MEEARRMTFHCRGTIHKYLANCGNCEKPCFWTIRTRQSVAWTWKDLRGRWVSRLQGNTCRASFHFNAKTWKRLKLSGVDVI